MIFFKPDAVEKNSVSITAFENNVNCGSCKMSIDEIWADVFELTYDKDKPYIVEGLLRSAYNYACNNNCYMGSCSCNNIEEFLKSMNFIFLDGKYVNDIPSILQGSCKKCYNN